MAVGLTPVFMAPDLCGSNHEGARLDRAGAQHHVPMGSAGRLGEGGWHRNRIAAPVAKLAEQGREAQIVADCQTKPPDGRIFDAYNRATRFIGIAFPPGLARRQFDIEHMDLVVSHRLRGGGGEEH